MVLAKIILSYYESSNPLPHRTLAIIKPDAVAAGNAENIIKQIDNNGFKIVAQKQVTIDKDTAAQFYEVHKNKPFFGDLIAYITSGPSVVLVLERLDAVHAWRNLMGATDPQKADPGTVRQLYGTDIQRNAVHGSDSKENAQTEIKLFFPELQ
jgi:nucleoside-diphosphate kinase